MNAASLVKRANRLLRSTSTEHLEAQWKMLCTSEVDSLLAELSSKPDDSTGGEPPGDEAWCQEFSLMLAEQAEYAKQQFFMYGGYKKR